jgi:hypothetical protein
MRIVTEQWLAASFAIEEGQQQRVTPEGLPSMRPDGQPEMEKVTTLVLIRQNQFEQQIIKVPFSDEARRKLAEALSGGVVIAKASDLGHLKPI